MDDQPNIVNNYYLHMESVTPQKLVNALYSNPAHPYELNSKLYRPVPCLTFALNWFWGNDNVFGYHLVNILIHICTAFILFLFILNLFNTPNLLHYKKELVFFVAAISTSYWALNPIQTQAVTYIVQRMAQMVALFYILAMYFYLKGRLSLSCSKQTMWFAGCFLSFLLALGSKENAAMLPATLLLMEIIFFQNLSNRKRRKKLFFISGIIMLMIFLFGTVAFMKGNPLGFMESYNHRTFSLTERILAQPRIVLFYISQIFYPLPSRLSIAHDVVLSSSLLTPWTTIPSILTILFLICFGVLKIKKMPILSFSLLFFFLNHLIESSFIPLELVFEHRNYLPSFFLFLPFALWIHYLINTHGSKNKIIYILTMVLIPSVLLFFSASTYIRNRAWQTSLSLWADAAQKAPNNARATSILAMRLGWGKHSIHPSRYDMALKLFEDSLGKQFPTKSMKADILGNMAGIYHNNKKNYKKAMALYQDALKIDPGNLKIRHDMVRSLILMNRMDDALDNTNMLIERNDKNEVYHNNKGLILLWKKEYKQALLSFLKAKSIAPQKPKTIFYLGVTLNLLGDHKNSENYLLKALESSPQEMAPILYLIDNSLKANDKEKINIYIKKLIDSVNKATILEELDAMESFYGYPPISLNLISPLIRNKLNLTIGP